MGMRVEFGPWGTDITMVGTKWLVKLGRFTPEGAMTWQGNRNKLPLM
jgi:hypothetical protein